MGRIKHIRTAIKRYHKSNGFGIHSPFAYGFVRNVLCLRSVQYYGYEQIEAFRQKAIAISKLHVKHPRVISVKNAKMIFRITNFFQPTNILQIGTSYGVSSACMMLVSSKSSLFLHEPQINKFRAHADLLQPYENRIIAIPNLRQAVHEYSQLKSLPFVLVNDLPIEQDYELLRDYLFSIIDQESTVVIRNISRNKMLMQLWCECKEHASHGMTFNNDKIAVMIANPKLPKQDFYLWF